MAGSENVTSDGALLIIEPVKDAIPLYAKTASVHSRNSLQLQTLVRAAQVDRWSWSSWRTEGELAAIFSARRAAPCSALKGLANHVGDVY